MKKKPIKTVLLVEANPGEARLLRELFKTVEELEFLRAHRCDEAQGFYFNRPAPPQHFAGLLRTGVPKLKDIQCNNIVPEPGSAWKSLDARCAARRCGRPLRACWSQRAQSE
jgi:hypothetical protein